MEDLVVIGAGIVGLATAWQYMQTHPDQRVIVVDKEQEVAFHQTGHNSGVIHCGIYYKPGSLKAKFCREGNQAMVDFCQAHDVPFHRPGKLIAAVKSEEIPALDALYKRGLEHGLPVHRLSVAEIREREPYLTAVDGIYAETTGTVDYAKVCQKLADLIIAQGGEIRLGEPVKLIREQQQHVVMETNKNTYKARFLVACAGLQSDRLARMAGLNPGVSIIPFRGEYFQIVAEKAHLINHLIYPVPDPKFPFLGVHFTRMHDDTVKIGPNAVLSLARENYRRRGINWRDMRDIFLNKGFWRMSKKYWRTGVQEQMHSWAKSMFVESAQGYIPELRNEDVHYVKSGIRAQALNAKGELLDDFAFVHSKHTLHVINAPSPAATACLPIGQAIVEKIVNT